MEALASLLPFLVWLKHSCLRSSGMGQQRQCRFSAVNFVLPLCCAARNLKLSYLNQLYLAVDHKKCRVDKFNVDTIEQGCTVFSFEDRELVMDLDEDERGDTIFFCGASYCCESTGTFQKLSDYDAKKKCQRAAK